MDYVAPLGLPHSQFLQWSDDDQDKALAWQRYVHGKCPGCGTYDDEWRDETGLPVEPPPYVIEGRRCEVCKAMHEFQERTDVQKNSIGLHATMRPYDELKDAPRREGVSDE